MADYPNANDDTELGLLQRIFAALTGGNAGGATVGSTSSNIGVASAVPDNIANTAVVPRSSAGTAFPLLTFGMVYSAATDQWSKARGTADGAFVVSVPSATSPGLLQHSRMATADINATVIKATPGKVYGFQIFNNTASAKYVRLYDKASAPAPAADSALIRRRLIIPANGIVSYHVGQGIDGFAAGIAYVASGAAGDTDTTALAANDLVINVDYR